MVSNIPNINIILFKNNPSFSQSSMVSCISSNTKSRDLQQVLQCQVRVDLRVMATSQSSRTGTSPLDVA